MEFVTRTEWGAPLDTPAADMPTARGSKIHWIGGPYDTPAHDACHNEVLAIRAEHLADPHQGWVDIAYNLVVCQHGVVYEARGKRKESGANGDQPLNLAHYAICAIQGTNEELSGDLKNGLRDAIEYLQGNGAGGEILAHRDGYNTDCPGDELYEWVHAGAPRPGGQPAPQPEPHPAPAWEDYDGHLIENFTRGFRVTMWQTYMAWRGWPIDVDGMYGPQSEQICRLFQAEKMLTVDGKIGPITWRATHDAPIS
jgi:hypothetical protein